MTSEVIRTEQPVLHDGISSIAFFNGRLLTGEDLTREQLATTEARLRVGRVLGSGVACGLHVSPAPTGDPRRPVLTVTPGRAVNARGAVMELSRAVDVHLTRDGATGSAPEAIFTDCKPLQPGTYLAGAGTYVLTVAPARRGVGRAPVSGLQNTRAQCNVAYSVEGVQFDLLRIALPASALATPAKSRNRVMHLMVGTSDADRLAALANPLAQSPSRYGMLDELVRQGCISEDQVPLAFVLWTGSGGVVFVDHWAVRRRLHLRDHDLSAPLTGTRVRVDAQAVLDQFHEHVLDLVRAETANEALTGETAAARFDRLPPVALVPIIDEAGKGGGWDPDKFLGVQGSQEAATLDAESLRGLVRESLDHTPYAVGGETRVQRYLVWETEQALAAGLPVRRVMVLAREGIAYRGTARYGKARYALSRYAPSVI